MIRRMKQLMAVAIAAVTLAVTPVAALATETTNTPVQTNTTATGESVTFDKYLIMDENANVPNYTPTFTISGDASLYKAATATAPEVYAGLTATGTPTVTCAPFEAPTVDNGTITANSGSATSATLLNGDTLPAGKLTEGKKYAVAKITVDLSSVEFTKPGIYRYQITENNPAEGTQGITIDSAPRYLDVYVESDDAGKLSIAGYVIHTDAEEVTAIDKDIEGVTTTMGSDGTEVLVYNLTGKDTGFTNEYATYDLSLSKKVTGNQGDRTEYFAFTVEISGAAAGTVYNVVYSDTAMQNKDLNGDNANDNTVTARKVSEGGTVTQTFYLKNNQTVTIQGLTADTKYQISETEKKDTTANTNEGYEVSYVINDGDDTTTDAKVESAAMATAQQLGASDDAVTFTNYRNGVVPTGLLMTIAPYIVMILIAGAALAVFLACRRRKAAN